MKITEQDRQAARAAHEQQRVRMSEAAKAKLREQNERDKTNSAAESLFVERFMKLPREVPAMRYVLRKIYDAELGAETTAPVAQHLSRMAEKVLACLAGGLVPACVHDVALMAELAQDELKMVPEIWDAQLEHYAHPRKAKAAAPATPKARRCALGAQCAFACRRQPAIVHGSGIFCSPLCKARARAKKQHQPAPSSQEVAISDQCSCGSAIGA